jgi:hypothetical protein
MPRTIPRDPHGWGMSPGRAAPWISALLKAVMVVAVLGFGLHMLYH